MGEKDIQSGDDGLRTNPGSEQRISTNQIMIWWPQMLQLSSSPLLYFFFWYLMEDLNYFFSMEKTSCHDRLSSGWPLWGHWFKFQ